MGHSAAAGRQRRQGTVGFQLTFSHDKAGQSHAALVPILAAVELLHPVLPDLPHQGVKSIFHTLNANTRSGIFFPQAFEITDLSMPEPLNGFRTQFCRKSSTQLIPWFLRGGIPYGCPSLTPPGVTATKINMENWISGRFHAGSQTLLA